jgi:vacuolar protein sorting-associated protein VTA1
MIQFALKIFLAADNEDRSGQASKKTARLFLVASHFMETLRVFGEVGEEIEDRIRYAKWKASDIVKALNEGRQPVAGPPGAKDESIGSPETAESPAIAHHLPQNQETFSPPPPQQPSNPSAPEDRRKSSGASERNLPSLTGSYTSPPPPPTANTPPVPPKAPSPPTSYSAPPHPVPDVRPPAVNSLPHTAYSQSPHVVFDQAEKHCRYATSAIQFEDVPTAIKEMEAAIAILRALQSQ